ncbi:hypothetical protein ACFQX6_03595 [Streptosporangium lutulentum]
MQETGHTPGGANRNRRAGPRNTRRPSGEVRVLARRGWLTFDGESGPMAPGPALGAIGARSRAEVDRSAAELIPVGIGIAIEFMATACGPRWNSTACCRGRSRVC